MSYVYIGAAFIMACLVAGMLWFRAEAASARAELDMARVDLKIAMDANAAQQATIGRLRAEAEANDKLLAEMAADVEAIRQGQEETGKAIEDLQEASDDVRTYLNTAVPADLRKLLDK
jgi:LysB family phage lysis regulatory protein